MPYAMAARRSPHRPATLDAVVSAPNNAPTLSKVDAQRAASSAPAGDSKNAAAAARPAHRSAAMRMDAS